MLSRRSSSSSSTGSSPEPEPEEPEPLESDPLDRCRWSPDSSEPESVDPEPLEPAAAGTRPAGAAAARARPARAAAARARRRSCPTRSCRCRSTPSRTSRSRSTPSRSTPSRSTPSPSWSTPSRSSSSTSGASTSTSPEPSWPELAAVVVAGSRPRPGCDPRRRLRRRSRRRDQSCRRRPHRPTRDRSSSSRRRPSRVRRCRRGRSSLRRRRGGAAGGPASSRHRGAGRRVGAAPVVGGTLDRDAGRGGDRADHRHHGRLREHRRAPGRARDRGAAGHGAPRDRLARAGLDQHAHDRQRHQEPDALADSEPRAVDQLADGAGARADRGGDLLVGVALDRAAHERLALGLGQRAHGAHHPCQLLVGERDLGGLSHAVDLLGEGRVRACVPSRVQRPVANDRVEPRLQANLLGRSAQRVPRADEALLDHVLGSIGWRVGSREGDQAGAITADDLLEGGIAPLSREGDQTLIRLGAQHRSRERFQSRSSRHSLLTLTGPAGPAQRGLVCSSTSHNTPERHRSRAIRPGWVSRSLTAARRAGPHC